MSGEIQTTGGMDVNKIMALALEKGDVAQLEKMMELQERYEANEARKAYHAAMAAFKADPPKIVKDAHVNFTHSKGTTDYRHATLANVTTVINTALSQHGLSAAWATKQDEKGIEVTCKITHIAGHFEETSLKAGADISGGKNNIQGIGSTVTYLERYTLLALTGLATHEGDDDGVGSEAEYIDDEQIATINDYVESTGTDFIKFKRYMEVDDIGKILKADYGKAIKALKMKEKKK